MPSQNVDVKELPTRFSELIALAETGTEVIVTDDQVPRAKLVPLHVGPLQVLGLHPGAIRVSEDFDAPLPESFWTGEA
jgi:antitoxin (DNA-binding transcriptional repressor) of toxin-antitoxin stability system